MPVPAKLPARLLLIGAAQVVATVLIGLLARDVFRNVSTGEAGAVAALGALAGLTLVSIWLRYLERVEGESFGQAVSHEIRLALARHLTRLPSQSSSRPAAGGLVLRFVGDLRAIANWRGRGQVALVISAPVALAGIGLLIVLDWHAGVAAALVVGAAVLIQNRLAPRLEDSAHSARRHRGRLAGLVSEIAAALPSIQLFGGAGRECRRIASRSAQFAAAMRERARWLGLMRAAAEFGAAGLPVAILLSLSLLGGEPSTAFVALTLSALIAPRLRELGRVAEYRCLARISEQRIAGFLARQPLDERREAKGLARRAGRLALRSVSLAGVFDGISVEAPPGGRVALTGPNGAGKTRLLGVIAGLEPPSSGRVVIDGQNATARRLSAQRRLVAMAGCQMPLRRGTVDQNIAYGARVRGAERDEVLNLGGYDELVAGLEKGGATRIGADGAGLSAGQRARVLLLRALMRRPVVLLLDEIDAPLDAAGSAVLERVLQRYEGTVVFATHHAVWRAACDCEGHLADGRLETREISTSGRRYG